MWVPSSLIPRLSPHKCHNNCVTFDRMCKKRVSSLKFSGSTITTLLLCVWLRSLGTRLGPQCVL